MENFVGKCASLCSCNWPWGRQGGVSVNQTKVKAIALCGGVWGGGGR